MYRKLLLGLAWSAVVLNLTFSRSAYATILANGQVDDEQTSIGYSPFTGEVFVNSPLSTDLTSILITSAASIFTGDPANNLNLPPGGLDIDEDDRLFKQTIGSSFGSLSFGNVAQPGLSETFIRNDLEVTGSLFGGGGLQDVDLIFVPEPSTATLLFITGSVFVLRRRRPSAPPRRPV